MKKNLYILLFTVFVFGDSLQSDAQIITTIAGDYGSTDSGDGGPATAATLGGPWAVAIDNSGNMYIAEWTDQRIRKVNSSGIISTFAGGGGAEGYSVDGGPATGAGFYNPDGIATDNSGNVYIADGSNRIYQVNSSGIIYSFAGNGVHGFYGDGGPAYTAEIGESQGVAVDNSGNVYIADADNNRIRKVNKISGIISTIAGNGTGGYSGDGGPATLAELNNPSNITVDAVGNVFISDNGNEVIRRVNTSGIISTIAGNDTGGYSGDGGPATIGELADPQGVAVDDSGNIYIADVGNSRIRKVNTSGIINTFAGNGFVSFGGDGGPATLASLNSPAGLAVDGSGNVYIADNGNNRIRKVTTPITGINDVCVGATITLSDASIGGTWSSNNTTIATVGSSTGIVTGVSAGTDTITYNLSSGMATAIITIKPLPIAGTISGTSKICLGSTPAMLTDTTAGGTWSSSNSSATISDSIVTGVSIGIDTIEYSIINSCGTAIATHIIAINPLPDAGLIEGDSTVCESSIIMLTDTTTSGVWSSSNSSATISGGVVTGITSGTDIIRYAVTNTCGTATAIKNINVNPLPSSGTITGTDSVCVGYLISLANTAGGGIWSSAKGFASVDSVGVVAGVSEGLDTIVYTTTNDCGTTDAVFPIAVLSGASCVPAIVNPKSLISNNIKIYPNPNQGVFTILILSSIDEQAVAVITNIIGERVKEFTLLTNKAIDIKLTQPSGVYFISAVTQYNKYVAKITLVK